MIKMLKTLFKMKTTLSPRPPSSTFLHFSIWNLNGKILALLTRQLGSLASDFPIWRGIPPISPDLSIWWPSFTIWEFRYRNAGCPIMGRISPFGVDGLYFDSVSFCVAHLTFDFQSHFSA